MRFAVAFAVVCLLVAGVLIATSAGGSTAQVNSQNLLVSGQPSASAPVQVGGEEHPAFARLDDRNLLLPIAAEDATIIAYQGVSDEGAIPIEAMGERSNANGLVRFFRSIFSGDPSVRYFVLAGEGSAETTSVLIGALPGSPVTAPISGVITGVKEYKLHGKYDDVQVDIRPQGASGTTVSLLFISDPVVSIGEVVTAGKTQLGKVRQCPPELGQALSYYSHDSGSHVHLQATEEPIS